MTTTRPPLPEFTLVQTTTDSPEEAERLARTAVQRRLAACVQISEIRSYFRWDESGGRPQVGDEQEYRLDLKTTVSAVPALHEFIAHEHSYDQPEIIMLPIIGGSEGYLSWVRSETDAAGQTRRNPA